MKKNISCFLLVLWLLIIFFFSHQSGSTSGEESSSLLYQIFYILFQIFKIDATNLMELINTIHNPFREMMHMLEYFILAILFINVLNQNNIKKNNIIITIMFGFICATIDEIHQAFIPGRTFEYFDIMMDMIGIVLGSLINKIIRFKH